MPLRSQCAQTSGTPKGLVIGHWCQKKAKRKLKSAVCNGLSYFLTAFLSSYRDPVYTYSAVLLFPGGSGENKKRKKVSSIGQNLTTHSPVQLAVANAVNPHWKKWQRKTLQRMFFFTPLCVFLHFRWSSKQVLYTKLAKDEKERFCPISSIL